MANIYTNQDVPLSWRIPGTYVLINPNSPGSGIDEHTLLILGERLSTGQKAADVIYEALSEQDVIDGSGRGSAPHVAYMAATSQVSPGIVRTMIGNVAVAGAGVAAAFTILYAGTASTNGKASIWVNGREASVAFATSDTATTVATAIKAELDKLTDLPVTFGISTATITATHRHTMLHGNDTVFRFFVTPSSGITVGPGRGTLASNAVGDGSVRFINGANTVSAAITTGDTPAVIAASLNTAFGLLTDFPVLCTPTTPASANLDFTYVNGWDVRHSTLTILSSTGTTIAWNGGAPVAAGTVAPAGVIGSGAPTLTTILSTLTNHPVYAQWVVPWADTTTLGTIATHIEAQADGRRQKGQKVHFGLTSALATAGAVPSGTSPTLTSSTRYAGIWLSDGPQIGIEYAARVAAARAAESYPAKNYDGFALKTNDRVPLQAPNRYPSQSDINAAINTYALTPLNYDRALGKTVIVFARTTSTSSDRVLHDFACIDQLDWQRNRIVERFNDRFSGKMRMRSGTPFSPDILTLDSFEDAMYELTVEWERLGQFDGADALKDGIKADENSGDPTRVDLIYTASVLVPHHITAVVANRGSAAQ